MRIRLRGADIYIQFLEANRSSKVTLIWDHFNEQIKVICLLTRMFCYISAQRIENMWLLLLSVAHMDGAVGSESTAGIWFRHPDCIYCCDIKSAAYRMQPYNPPSADNGATMAILETCFPIPHLMNTNSPRTMTTCTSIDQSWHNQNFWLTIVFGKLIGWCVHAKPSVLCTLCSGVGKAKYLLDGYGWSRWVELIWVPSTLAGCRNSQPHGQEFR